MLVGWIFEIFQALSILTPHLSWPEHPANVYTLAIGDRGRYWLKLLSWAAFQKFWAQMIRGICSKVYIRLSSSGLRRIGVLMMGNCLLLIRKYLWLGQTSARLDSLLELVNKNWIAPSVYLMIRSLFLPLVRKESSEQKEVGLYCTLVIWLQVITLDTDLINRSRGM